MLPFARPRRLLGRALDGRAALRLKPAKAKQPVKAKQLAEASPFMASDFSLVALTLTLRPR